MRAAAALSVSNAAVAWQQPRRSQRVTGYAVGPVGLKVISNVPVETVKTSQASSAA